MAFDTNRPFPPGWMTRTTRTGETIITCPVHTITSVGATNRRAVRRRFGKSEWPLDLLNAFTAVVELRRELRAVTRASLAAHMGLTEAEATIWLHRLVANGAVRRGVGSNAAAPYFVAPRFAAFGESLTGK